MILKDGFWQEEENNDVLNILMTSEQARTLKEYYLKTNDSACKKAIRDILDALDITIDGINLR